MPEYLGRIFGIGHRFGPLIKLLMHKLSVGECLALQEFAPKVTFYAKRNKSHTTFICHSERSEESRVLFASQRFFTSFRMTNKNLFFGVRLVPCGHFTCHSERNKESAAYKQEIPRFSRNDTYPAKSGTCPAKSDTYAKRAEQGKF